MNDKKRIIIASGGTGGHFYPGFSLACELKKKGWEPLFIVKKNDISIPALQNRDFPFAELDLSPFPRSFNPVRQIRFLAGLLSALRQARLIIKDFCPAAVLGTGSYIGFPAVLAARSCGCPAFIHESNAVFGLGNRLLLPFCDKAALGLPVKNIRSGKTVLTGTPVRETFMELPGRSAARSALGLAADKFTVLVFGGSQGAAAINKAVISVFKQFSGRIQGVHVTGRKKFGEVTEEYRRAGVKTGKDFIVFDYREDMPLLFAAADLVISRSGASTVAELIQTKKPALLIPYPYAAGNHQKFNAEALAAKKCAVCIEESDKFYVDFLLELSSLITEPQKLQAMREAWGEAGFPQSSEAPGKLADMIEKNC